MSGNEAAVTRAGIEGARPGREAPSDFTTVRRRRRRRGGGRGERAMVPDAEFRSYYGLPILNKPVWSSTDIAGYLFLGGLAGASSLVGAAADLRGEDALARVAKSGAAASAVLSLGALVHDLGRPMRFLNMLRVVKVTSPMNLGAWLLSAYAPAALTAAGSALTGRLRLVGFLGTAGAAALGPALASYTAVLISDTAVPAWHDCFQEMPFVFVGSGAMAAGGLGLLGAPVDQQQLARRVGALGAVAEVGALKLMEHRAGVVAEPYHQGRSGRLMKLGEGLAVGGSALALLSRYAGRRRRAAGAAAGAMLMAGSVSTRFGIFSAGVASAEDPRYVVQPQRERLRERLRAEAASAEAGRLEVPEDVAPVTVPPVTFAPVKLPEVAVPPPPTEQAPPSKEQAPLRKKRAPRPKVEGPPAKEPSEAAAVPDEAESIQLWQQSDGDWRWRWRSRDGSTVLVSHRAYDSLEEAAHAAQEAYPDTRPPGAKAAAAAPIDHPGLAAAGLVGAAVAGVLRRRRS